MLLFLFLRLYIVMSVLSRRSFTLTLFCSQGKELKMNIGAKTAKLETVVTFMLALVVTSPVVLAAIAVI